MAAAQKRMLTAHNSKLAKADITVILRKEDAWLKLPLETRQQLYSLLPAPKLGEEAPIDPDVHPLKTPLKPYIEAEMREWQADLREGREAKKWRDDAIQAGVDRLEGKFDEWKEMQREEYWGKEDEENVGDLGEEGVNGDVCSAADIDVAKQAAAER